MTQREWPRLLVAFVVTRGLLVALTGATLNIAASRSDIALYSSWGAAIGNGIAPYSEIAIEYPPGILPFVFLADLIASGVSYRFAFTLVMVAVDIAGFVGLVKMGRERGSLGGAWIWVVALFLLGPVVYLRLDLVPAVATLWAIERSAASASVASGALFGLGVITKLYPILLMPAALWHSARRSRFVAAASAAVVVALLPFIGVLPKVWDQVLGYHADRGIQIESSWGSGLLLALRGGYDVSIGFAFGASHVDSPISPTLETIAAVLSVGAVVASTWIVVAWVRRGDWRGVAVGFYGSLAIVMVTGTVLSPQFIVWLIALAAAALCFEGSPARIPLLMVVPIAALTQFVFPFTYEDLKAGELGPLLLLITRNLLILGAGAAALLALRKSEAGN